MFVFVCQIFNFLPYSANEMYCDDKDGRGIIFWFKKADKINRENKRLANAK